MVTTHPVPRTATAVAVPPRVPPEPLFLALAPASPAGRKLAFGAIVASVALFAALAPVATVPLARIEPFIPAYEAALIIIDLLTAALFFGQAALTRSRSLLVLASGYLFAGLLVIPHALTFPGLFAPGGLIGATTQSTAWIYMLWHGGFPLFVAAYALTKGDGDRLAAGRVAPAIALAAAAVMTLVAGLTLLATRGSAMLPAIMSGNGETAAMLPVVTVTWLMAPLAVAVLWWRRAYTSLDLWLIVVLFAWAMDVALSAVLNAARFDVGFYAGRIYGLAAASLVMAMLLLENNALYMRLADALKQTAAAKKQVDDYARRLEGKVEATEQTYREFVQEARDGILALTPAGAIVDVNNAAAKALGRERGDLIGRQLADLIPAAADGSFDLGVVQVQVPGDRKVHLDVSVSPVRTGESDVRLIIARDVTERTDLQVQLQQAQKMETIGQLTGGMAHDFNNLLTVIIGNLEIMLENQKIEPATRDFAARAMRAGQRGGDLTRKLLAFARRQPLEAASVDANELMRNVVEMLHRTLGEHVIIEARPRHGLWRAMADATQVESAITNLAVNARDAMPNGGRLTIETDNAHLDADYVATNPDTAAGDYVMIAVSDTGTGIPPEVLKRVFEPFFTTKGPGKGTGLGLAMIYGFAKQSKGHVKIYSEVGYGTTVRLYLPRAKSEGAGAVAATEELIPRPATILLTEDNVEVRTVTAAQLRSVGCTVIEADSGPAALAALGAAAHVDILLTDMVMPGGMTGLQLAEAVRKLRPEIGIVFVSGFSEAAIHAGARLRELGPMVSKPYSKADLMRALRRVQDERAEAPPSS